MQQGPIYPDMYSNSYNPFRIFIEWLENKATHDAAKTRRTSYSRNFSQPVPNAPLSLNRLWSLSKYCLAAIKNDSHDTIIIFIDTGPRNNHRSRNSNGNPFAEILFTVFLILAVLMVYSIPMRYSFPWAFQNTLEGVRNLGSGITRRIGQVIGATLGAVYGVFGMLLGQPLLLSINKGRALGNGIGANIGWGIGTIFGGVLGAVNGTLLGLSASLLTAGMILGTGITKGTVELTKFTFGTLLNPFAWARGVRNVANFVTDTLIPGIGNTFSSFTSFVRNTFRTEEVKYEQTHANYHRPNSPPATTSGSYAAFSSNPGNNYAQEDQTTRILSEGGVVGRMKRDVPRMESSGLEKELEQVAPADNTRHRGHLRHSSTSAFTPLQSSNTLPSYPEVPVATVVQPDRPDSRASNSSRLST